MCNVGKSDALDAEAICEAVSRPTMRFATIKTVEQQAVLTLHRAREILVKPRFESANVEKNLRLRSALEAIVRRKNASLTQLSIAWPMAQGSRAGAFIVPIPGAKSRKHLEENVRAADIVLTADDLAEIDRIVPPGAASGTRYPIGQMHRVNL